MSGKQTVLIAGGGASGALVAAHLLASPECEVVLFEPAERLGRGMAYGTTCPAHLLNVPAGKMSAVSGKPDHFLRWLGERGYAEFQECSFVPRMIFGDYVESILSQARAAAEGRFRHVRAEAADVEERGDGVVVRSATGDVFSGDRFVLALGNAAPAPWPGLAADVRDSGRFVELVWGEQVSAIGVDDPVLTIGAGLTGVDAFLSLRESGRRGKITMVSRRGLLPRAHKTFGTPTVPFLGDATARGLCRNMRVAAADAELLDGDWRLAIDSVRAETNDLWEALGITEQRRFLRHLRAYWDAHRHRMAPRIYAALERELAAGTLEAMAGRIGRLELDGDAIAVEVRRRGKSAAWVRAARVINCTGADPNLARLPSRLIRNLIGNGLLMSNPVGFGGVFGTEGELVNAEGAASKRLFAIGPMRLGTLFESIAMPEIREQAARLADTLLAAARFPVLMR